MLNNDDKIIGSRGMDLTSFISTDPSPEMDMIMKRCEAFIAPDSEPITEAFSVLQNEHLLIGVNNRRYRLGLIGDQKPDQQIDGLYSLEQLFNLRISRPEKVIEDLLYAGDTMLLAGRPKVGKSRLIHQMVASLSEGTSFLGMKVPRSRRILLVDLENKPWAIGDRLQRIAGELIVQKNNVFVWCSETLAGNRIDSTKDGVQKLKAFLGQTGAEVLIIDPWRLWLGKDENDANDVVKGLQSLSDLREGCPGLAIVVVHHVRKERFESPLNLLKNPSLWMDNISGHHALVGHVDACFGLERQELDGEEVVAFGGVARNVAPRTVLLNDDPETLRFDVANNEESLVMALTEKEKGLWEKAKAIGRFTWSSFLEELKIKNKKLISSMLKKAESHGLLEKSDQGYRTCVDG